MNRFILVMIFVLSCGMLLAESSKEDNFVLPDLFVTAKDENVLDSAYKIDSIPSLGLRAEDNMVDGGAKKDTFLLEKTKLSENMNKLMYNDVSFVMGLSNYLDIVINHGYSVSKMPYFFSFSRFSKFAIYNVENTGGDFVFAIKPDAENNLSFMTKQKQLDGSNLSIYGLGFNHYSKTPFSYVVRFLNANAYVANPSVQYIEHNAKFGIGSISVSGTKLDAKAELKYLGSNNNKLGVLDLVLAKDFDYQGVANNLSFGIQLWTNVGFQKFNFLIDHQSTFLIGDLDIRTNLQLIHEPKTIESMYSVDFIEMDDAVMRCDERFSFGVSVNGVIDGMDETLYFDFSNYSYLNLLDDIGADDYYAFTGFNDVAILNMGAYFPVLQVASESISAKVNIPVVSKKVPNLFNEFLEITYKKDILSGELGIVGSYYLPEFGRTGSVDKDGVFEIDLSYEEAISSDWSFGLYVQNVLSAGNNYLPGRNYGDSILYGKLKIIF